MNTLVYSDVSSTEASGASTISSTAQQMSMSFAVALASLVSAFLIPDHASSTPLEFMSGIHKAFLLLGALTVISAIIFARLKVDDGESISHTSPAV
jgi:hypothetical protein